MALVAREVKRRANRPKTRTGCLTCRARRVKCGEERPACRNCCSTGRHCDGYEIGFVLFNETKKNQRVAVPHSDTPRRQLQMSQIKPGFSVALDAQERQAFEFFKMRTSFDLPGHALLNSWEKLVLQMSHTEPVLVRAIVAVGAIHHARGSALWNGMLADQDPIWDEFSLQQYSKSVTGLKEIIEGGNRDKSTTVTLVLVICLMFVRFEMLHDRDDLVIQHLQLGLKVLREHLHGHLPPVNGKGSIMLKLTPKTTVEELAVIFARLDCDSTLLGVREPLFPIFIDDGLLGCVSFVHSAFSSSADARLSVDTLTNAVYCAHGELLRLAEAEICKKMDVRSLNRDWYQCLAEAGSRVVDIEANGPLKSRIRELEEQIAAWSGAIMSMTEQLEKQDRLAWVMIQLQFFFVWMRVISWRSTRDDLYNEFTATIFPRALHQTEQVLLPPSVSGKSKVGEERTQSPPWPMFGLTGGVLLSVFSIAIKCRDSLLRRRAVDLLCRSNIQEGLFDNFNLAIYAQQIIDLEENQARQMRGFDAGHILTCDDIPNEARFIDVRLPGDLEEFDIGRIVCARLDNRHSIGVRVEEHLFSTCAVAQDLRQSMGC